MLRKLLMTMIILSCSFCLPVIADQKDNEIAELKNQVQQLRSENQDLRLKLAQKGATEKQPIARSTEPAVPATATGYTQQQEQTFWLTTSSKKRHNSSCRYYKKSTGRLCTKDEGIACKICGG